MCADCLGVAPVKPDAFDSIEGRLGLCDVFEVDKDGRFFICAFCGVVPALLNILGALLLLFAGLIAPRGGLVRFGGLIERRGAFCDDFVFLSESLLF